MINVAIFLFVSASLAILSIRSLKNPRSHGFYRFFAFESILVLILLNVDAWFVNPFSPHQLVAWMLLCVSLFLAIHGFFLLIRVGKPTGTLEGSSNLGIENTTTLVKTGVYGFIRHPLYTSLVFGGWGVFFKDPSLIGAGLAVANSAFLTLTAKVEEKENLNKFGDEYKEYMKSTRMFIPYVFAI